MKLHFKKDSCSYCNKCMETCPNSLEMNALACRHCAIAEAACVIACKRGAIYEIANGVLAVDESVCNACGACIDACKEKAMCVVNGKAAKCDVCAKNDFFVVCTKACTENALSLRQTWAEIKEVEKLMGWRVIPAGRDGAGKILKTGNGFEIIGKSGGRKEYLLKEFPSLAPQEALLLREVLDRFKSNDVKAKKTEIYGVLKDHCIKNLIELGEEQKNYFQKILNSLIFGYGPVSELLKDDDIEEIAAIGIGQQKPVRIFHRNFGWMETNFYFADELSVMNVVNRMARGIGRRLTLQKPKLNAVLNDGSRLNATIPPISFSGPSFTIRKFKKRPFTPLELIKNRTMNTELVAFLWAVLQTDSSLVIAGNTGSGKTSTMNALFSFVPPDERIIITEETPEIFLPHRHVVKLNVVENLDIGMQELITDTLRMRPDRIIVGEIRNRAEVGAFIDTLLAGQGKGSYATFHSQSAKETIIRMKSLGVLEMDLGAIDLILIQKRWNRIDLNKGSRKEVRRVVEVAEVLEDNGKIKLNTLFGFNYKKDVLERKNQGQKLMKKAMKCFSLSEAGMRNEIKRRKQKLEGMMRKNFSIDEFFREVNGFGD